MTRYYFHLRDGHTLPDAEGTELPGLEAAQVQAAVLAAETLKWRAEAFLAEGEWNLDVTDKAGLTLFSLCFLAFHSPEVQRYRRQL